MSTIKLPNELLVQVEKAENFWKMSSLQRLNEVNWCLERCYTNAEEYPEKRRYMHQQIKELKRFYNILQGD